MKKLKLEHLAPYLPYGLKRHCPGSSVLIHDYVTIDFSQGMIDSHRKMEWKPILRPLSDLPKEIEIDGINFIPNNVLAESSITEYWWQGINTFGISPNAHFALILLLLEWHFDVFGLIENGLAININTIK